MPTVAITLLSLVFSLQAFAEQDRHPLDFENLHTGEQRDLTPEELERYDAYVLEEQRKKRAEKEKTERELAELTKQRIKEMRSGGKLHREAQKQIREQYGDDALVVGAEITAKDIEILAELYHGDEQKIRKAVMKLSKERLRLLEKEEAQRN